MNLDLGGIGLRTRCTIACVALAGLTSLVGACASSDEIVPGDNAKDGSAALTRAEAVGRAEEWVDAQLHYCGAVNGGIDMADKCWPMEGPSHRCQREHNPEWDPYRSDCSGFVSWAWALPAPGRSTLFFAPYDTTVSFRIDARDLEPGDALNLRENGHNHIILFKNWEIPYERATFIDEPGCGATPHAREYTSNVNIEGPLLRVGQYAYNAIRYNGISDGGPGLPETPSSGSKAIPQGDVFGVKMNATGTSTTEVHVLLQSGGWQALTNETGTPLGMTSADRWAFTLGDYDGDGARDLFAVMMNTTGTKTTELHVLSAASNFQSWAIETGTPLGEVGPGQWQFASGDADGDHRADLYAIAMNGTGTGTTEVHVLSAASNYQSWLYETGTALEQRDPSNTAYLVGDYNHDGTPDLFVILMNKTGSATTEVHVLDGASYFQSYLLHTATGLAETDASMFRFALADADDDGALDLMAIATYADTGSKSTEVHVLSGASGFQQFSVHTGTALEPTTPGQWWFGAN